MADFDTFASHLLEEAKRFLEKAMECEDKVSKGAHLHAALMLAFCALEAHVNSMGEEFATGKDLCAHEKGLLLERPVRLEKGEFRLQTGLKISRLEDRIEFLHAKFSGEPLDRTSDWWARLGSAMELRNELTHAKTIPTITEGAVRSAIQAIIATLDTLYLSIYKRAFPPAKTGLQSRLTF